MFPSALSLRVCESIPRTFILSLVDDDELNSSLIRPLFLCPLKDGFVRSSVLGLTPAITTSYVGGNVCLAWGGWESRAFLLIALHKT
jgi:hypothetical protein